MAWPHNAPCLLRGFKEGFIHIRLSKCLVLADFIILLYRYDPIVVDSWQFIIIDRDVGMPFELFDIVEDILLMLLDDPSPEHVVQRTIEDVIPPASQHSFRKDVEVEHEFRYPTPPEVQYESNRQRSHDPDRQILLAHQKRMLADGSSREANRFIRRVIDDMERCGIISLAEEYEPPQTRPVMIQGSDGNLDVYFPYEFSILSSDVGLTPRLPLPRKSCLIDFARHFKSQNPKGIIAKGSILTHYCAWPMPAIRRTGKSRLNFGTWEGHVYHWNAMRKCIPRIPIQGFAPYLVHAETCTFVISDVFKLTRLPAFDRPWSSHAWQNYVQHSINSKYPFVMVYLTTFVICATDTKDAEKKAQILLKETETRDWRFILPSVRDWATSVNDLRLDRLFNGIGPM